MTNILCFTGNNLNCNSNSNDPYYNAAMAAQNDSSLVVMGRDSRSKGRGFDSRCRILDGRFSLLFVVQIVKFV